MEDSSAVGGAPVEHDGPAVPDAVQRSSHPPRSRVDRNAEDAALECLRRSQREQALKILMTAYGEPLTAFAVRVVRDRELAKDIRQQVFYEAFQGIAGFQQRSSLWSWLCGIAYHRCLDEVRRARRTGAIDHFDVLDHLASQPDPVMDQDRVDTRRALEHCLSKLSPPLRSQLLMRCFLGLSFVEIGELIQVPQGTVQVRVARALPKLRRCLFAEGVRR